MLNRRNLLKSVAFGTTLAFALPFAAQADQKLPVVTTFSILQDMVERVGGDQVAVTTLVGPNGDAHVYQPTPAAAKAVNNAELMFVNGLAFEGWLERLSEAADFKGTLVVATNGITPIAFEDNHDDHEDHDDEKDHDDHDHDDHGDEKHDDHDDEKDHDDHDHDKEHDDHDDHHDHNHGEFDPHAWLSPTLAVAYVNNIASALSQARPEQAGTFFQNRALYVAEIEALDKDIKSMMSQLPKERRSVVTSHDAFGYFGHEYGLEFLAPQGLSTESEVSAKDVAALIEHMRGDGIDAVFLENISDSRLLEQIASETGATIGGTLYPGALSEADGPAATYLDLMRHNATTLFNALK